MDIFEVGDMEFKDMNVLHTLTDEELQEKIIGYHKQGFEVIIGSLEYKRRKWRFIPNKIVKEITDDGKVLYR